MPGRVGGESAGAKLPHFHPFYALGGGPLERIAALRLKRGRDGRAVAGHPWIYQGELTALPTDIAPGGIVDVLDSCGRFVGRGYYNPASQICVRILTRTQEAIDADFFDRRLAEAIALRRRLLPDVDALRLVFSESDFLPGLIVDRYGDFLVVQFLTLGMDIRRELLLDLLVRRLEPRAIQERSEAGARRHEGLEPRVGACFGEVPDEVGIQDGGMRCFVDLRGGQKTGYFLDQRENRRAVAGLAGGRRMLDCFCHSGMFGIAAAQAGAVSVLGVDIDPGALRLAERNASLNFVQERCAFLEANAFDFLRAAAAEGREYDLVVLDPPAFTKSKLRVEQALRGYKEINLRAIKLLAKGGILVTCSCSHHVSPSVFQEVVQAAAMDAGRRLRLLQRRSQAPDHPVLLGIPETEYLKCLILEDAT